MSVGSMYGPPWSQTATAWNGSLGADRFPDPFLDMASLAMPQDISYANRWCEYIFMANGTYRQAVDRVLSYFITDIEITDTEADDDEKERWTKFLEETLDMKNTMHIVGLDLMCYGNSFTSIIPGFNRYLACPKCRCYEAPLRKIYNESVFRFKWSDFKFHAECPKCHFYGDWGNPIDRRQGEEGAFRIKRWSPHEIKLIWDPLTDDVAYMWEIPEEYARVVREGHIHQLERANWGVIQAIKNRQNLLFGKDVIYHMREDALAGLKNRGWGISRVLSNFRQAWYVQVLHRYNEAIALDYVIPFRLLTPVPGDKSTGADPLLNTNMGGFMGNINRIVREHRRNPTTWHTAPFPVQYMALGGDATKLAPKDLLDQGIEVLLNNIGIPVEIMKGSLQVQTAPAALRLFESSWSTLPHNFNGFLRFVIKQVSTILNWERMNARLMRVTHADDLQRQQSKLQLMMGGQVSQTTGLASIGVSYKDEVRRMMDDQKFQAKQQAKLQEEMQHSATMDNMMQPPQPGGGDPSQGGGQPQAGGDPSQAGAAGMASQSVVANLPVGPNQKITPEELLQRAQYVAQQIIGMPESQKDSELIKLKQVDPTLHDLVKAQMDDIRQQAKTQGGSMVLAQQFGKQGSSRLVFPEKQPRVLVMPKRIITFLPE